MAQQVNFSLNISSANDSMQGNECEELSWIVEGVMRSVRHGRTEGKIYDSNGNTVGNWSLDVEEIAE
jgi:hypothetical protein